MMKISLKFLNNLKGLLLVRNAVRAPWWLLARLINSVVCFFDKSLLLMAVFRLSWLII